MSMKNFYDGNIKNKLELININKTYLEIILLQGNCIKFKYLTNLLHNKIV